MTTKLSAPELLGIQPLAGNNTPTLSALKFKLPAKVNAGGYKCVIVGKVINEQSPQNVQFGIKLHNSAFNPGDRVTVSLQSYADPARIQRDVSRALE